MNAYFPLAKQTFRVVASPSPFMQAHTEFELPHGASIRDALELAQPDPLLRGKAIAWIGGHEINGEHFENIRPNAGTTLYIKCSPSDPVSLGVALGISTFWANVIISVGFSLVSTLVSFVISMVFAPAPPEISRGPVEPTVYNISGARNSPKPYAKVGRVLGKARVVPPYGAAPYTEIVDNDQFLRLIVVWSYGPCRITDLKIGETSITDFDEVEIETIEGAPGSSEDVTLYPAIARQEDLNISLELYFPPRPPDVEYLYYVDDEGYTGYVTGYAVQPIPPPYSEWYERSTPIETDEIGLTITWPNGFANITDMGDLDTNRGTITIEYRLTGAGSWTAWVAEIVTAKTLQPLRRSWRKTITRGQYDVRVKYSDLKAWDESGGDRFNCSWTALRSFQNEDPITLDGLCYSAIRIKATDQLNGVLDTVNAIVEAKIPAYDPVAGNWDTEDYTRNPADIYRFILTGPQNAKAVSSTSVDEVSLAEWWTFCNANNFTYGHYIDFDINVRGMLSQIAQSGRAAVSVVDGKWGVVIDSAKDVVVQHFTPRNSSGFSGSRLFPDQPHALRVRFVNEARDYQTDEMIVYDDGRDASNSSDFEAMEFPGVQTSDHAFVLARQLMAINKLRPEIFTFLVDIENLICVRGDRVRLNHDVPIIGSGYGRVKSVSGQTITLDDEVTIAGGASYSVRFRLSDGTNLLRNVVANIGTAKTISLSTSDASQAVPATGDLYMFGEAGEETLDLIVHKISPAEGLSAELECYPYAPEVFDAAAVVPPFYSKMSTISTRVIGGPSDPFISSVVSDETALIKTATGLVIPTIGVYFRSGTVDPAETGNRIARTAGFRVRWRETGGGTYTYSPALVDSEFFTVTGVTSGNGYDIGVQAFSADGATSGWVTVYNEIVIGTSAPPPTIDSFGLNTSGTYTYVEWTYPSIPLDCVGYEIRYHPDQAVTDWSKMTPIAVTIPRDARSFAVPSRFGSYGIKAIDVNSTRSLTALFINASLGDPLLENVLVTVTDSPDFTGAFTNTAAAAGVLYLDTSVVMYDWPTMTSVIALMIGDGTVGFASSGSYEFAGETDLGIVTTSRISAVIDASVTAFLDFISEWDPLSSALTLAGAANPDQASARLEVSYSAVDSPTAVYGGWVPFVTGEYTARHFKFRLILTTNIPLMTPSVSVASVVIDVPDRIVSGEDISTGAGTKAIVFSPAFVALKSVTVNGQDMAQGDYYSITGKARTGFSITFRNSLGNAVSRTFDYQALGYGRQKGT